MEGETSKLEEVIEFLESAIQRGLEKRWVDVRAVETVLEEMAFQFDGEDPLKPAVRSALLETKSSIEKIASHLAMYDRAVELREPDEQEVEGVRVLMERGQRLFR